MKKKGDLARQIIVDKDRQITALTQAKTQAQAQGPVQSSSQPTNRRKRGLDDITYIHSLFRTGIYRILSLNICMQLKLQRVPKMKKLVLRRPKFPR